MRRARILALLAGCLALTACAGSGPAGARIEPPPVSSLRACRHPAEFLPAPGQGDWEIIAGRIGDELIRCRGEKDTLLLWARGVLAAIGRSKA